MSLINRKTSKGFSLIEIYVTLAIMIIVIGVVYPFFISNTKALHETEAKSDLQREGQLAMKCITDKAMEAQYIAKLNDPSNINKLTGGVNLPINVGEFELYTGNVDSTTGKRINYNFKLDEHKLYYKIELLEEGDNTGGSAGLGTLISDNIDTISIEPIGGAASFDKSSCRGININIVLSKSSVKNFEISSQVYFRNNNNVN